MMVLNDVIHISTMDKRGRWICVTGDLDDD